MSDTDGSMAQEATVAAVIVNYNAGIWLRRCVKAALANTAITEVVVVDNASTDDSLAMLAQDITDDRCRIERLKDNFGFGYAVNVGATSVSTPYILLLNPDCLLRPTTIEILLAEIESASDVAACGPVILDSSGKEQRGSRRFEPTPLRAIARTFGQSADRGSGFDLHKTSLPKHPVAVDAVSGSCMLIRKSTFEMIEGMDEQFFLHCEDLDLCRRIRNVGQRVLFVPSTSVIHLQGASGRNLKVEWYKHRSMLMYHNKHAAGQTGAGLNLLLKLGVWLRFFVVAAPMTVFGRSGELTRHNPQQLIATDAETTIVIDGSYCASAQAMARGLVRQGNRVVLVRTKFARSANAIVDESDDSLLIVVSDEYLKKVSATEIGNIPVVYSFSPLADLNALYPDFDRLRVSRLVAVVLPAQPSREHPDDRQSAQGRQEQALQAAREHGIGLSILCPTLLYGDGTQSEIGRMCDLLKYFPIIPLMGDGSRLRQPLHVHDLVAACLNAKMMPLSVQRSYCLGGDQTLTHYELVSQIAALRQTPVRIYKLPVSVSKLVKRLFIWTGLTRFAVINLLIPENRDILCDNEQAREEIDFRPRKMQLR